MAAATVHELEPARAASGRRRLHGSSRRRAAELRLVRPPRFVLVGGVPGAGKTTVMTALAAARPGVTTVDPDRARRWLSAVLPAGIPYARYRPLVHVWSTLTVLALVLRGPTDRRRALVVHDPATRRGRRTWTGRLARWRRWDPVLVVVDVSRGAALQGQLARRRVLGARAFDRHWQRWETERPHLIALSHHGRGEGPWSAVRVVGRRNAVVSLARLLD